MVPTFLGSTVLVFTILQVAPGGPIDRAIMELQMGGAEAGGASSGELGSSVLPESALKELKRFYGFDKPIYQRYLIWLGIWPREIKHREALFSPDQSKISKRVGKRDGKLWEVYIEKGEDGKLKVFEADGSLSSVWKASVDSVKKDMSVEAVVFQTEFSGILTGNLGRSYIYAKPVTEVMAPRFRISLLLGLTGIILSYLICIPLGIKKAMTHGSAFDFASSVTIFIAYSIPGWALGGVLLVLLGGGSFFDVFPLFYLGQSYGLHTDQIIHVKRLSYMNTHVIRNILIYKLFYQTSIFF